MSKLRNKKQLEKFAQYLEENEKSKATIEKYMRDVKYFLAFVQDKTPDKHMILEYKQHLSEKYACASANSMIASLNSYLRFCDEHKLCVKQFKMQRDAYCSEAKELTKDEYFRLVRAAEQKGSITLSLIIQTICSTGIRVSELQFITVEALRKGEAVVNCKGKTRRVFIVADLRKKLIEYVRKKRLTSGPVFITKSGKPMCRSNIWREMKKLCRGAGVPPEKVFPHNLRHLFARTFYSIEKDIAKLADILGHNSINTTRIYIITTGTEHKRKLENMRLII